MQIEVVNFVSGLEFEAAFLNRLVKPLDGVPVSVLSLPDLRINKLATGRLRDLADLEELPKA